MVAERVEEVVWEFVVGLLVYPERMIAGVDGLIEQERLQLNGDPEREVRALRRELHELDLRRERAQSGAVRELVAEGPIAARCCGHNSPRSNWPRRRLCANWTPPRTVGDGCAS